jgi:hypothetical protein
MIMSLCVAAALTLGLPGGAAGQNRAMQRLLEGATRVDCHFSAIATGTWKDGVPEITGDTVDFDAAFYDINVDEGTAEAEGRFGASFIVVRYAFGYLHFMQSFSAGPLYVTSIIAQESTEGRMLAVHTRHEYSPAVVPGFTSRPEMYVGDCAVTE